MEFVTNYVPMDFNIFTFGDLHIGSSLHHDSGFQSLIDSMEKPYDGVSHNVGVCVGDVIEAIDVSDKRFDSFTADLNKMRADQQMEHFIERVYPIRKKLVTVLYGNHEHKLLKHYDYVKGACNTLDVPYGTYSCIVTFKSGDGRVLFKGFFTHGYGGISSTADAPERQLANMKIALKRKLWAKAGDCALMACGHTHKLIVAEPESKLYLTSDDDRVHQNYTSVPQNAEFIPKDLRWYVNTGSFLRLYRKGVSGYAERAMYDPVELGYAVVKVRGGLITGIDRVIV